MPVLHNTSDEKTHYSLVGHTALEEVSLHGDDETMMSYLRNDSHLWRRRFNILLFTSLTTIALLIGGGIYSVMVLGPLSCSCIGPGMRAMTPPGVKPPYCGCMPRKTSNDESTTNLIRLLSK